MQIDRQRVHRDHLVGLRADDRGNPTYEGVKAEHDTYIAAMKDAGVKVTVQGHHEQAGLVIDERMDRRGNAYYWLGFQERSHDPVGNSDLNAIVSNHISVTPLRLDLTAHDLVGLLAAELN